MAPLRRAYLRDVHREDGKIGSVYDSNVTDPDPFPYSAQQEGSDPILESGMAAITQAMVDFDTRVVGWKVDDRYNLLSYEVGRLWDRQGPPVNCSGDAAILLGTFAGSDTFSC